MAKLRCAWVSGMLQMVMSSVKPAVLIITLPGTPLSGFASRQGFEYDSSEYALQHISVPFILRCL